MVFNLEVGNIDGFCVGELWNFYVVKQNLGYVIVMDLDIWNGYLEKVLGMWEEWVNKYLVIYLVLVKVLLEVCEYCDDCCYC